MQFLDLHTHHKNTKKDVLSIRSLSVGHDDPTISDDEFLSIGLHPWFLDEGNSEYNMKSLNVLAQRKTVKMIGECGLDRLRGPELTRQIIQLEQQILLANELQKPVILHCVKAFSELIDIKKRLKPSVPLIIHGFSKNEKLAHQLLNQGFLLSFGAGIFKTGAAAAKLVQQLDLFFLETDDSTMCIADVYQYVANLRNCTVDELKALIFTNWKKIKLID